MVNSTEIDAAAEAKVTTLLQKAKAEEALEAAVQRDTFSFSDYVENGGVVMPSTVVDIFTDVEANYEIEQIDIERNRLEKMAKGARNIVNPFAAEEAALMERREHWVERNENSRFLFHLRGISPAVDDEIRRGLQARIKAGEFGEDDEGAWNQAINSERIAKSIVKIVNPRANTEDAHVWTPDEVAGMLSKLPRSETRKLIDVSAYLSIGVQLGDRRVDAGFPGGSSDVAGEPSALSGVEDGAGVG